MKKASLVDEIGFGWNRSLLLDEKEIFLLIPLVNSEFNLIFAVKMKKVEKLCDFLSVKVICIKQI